MDCRDFEKLLERFESDALPPAEHRVAERHLDECLRCRRLHETVCGQAEPVAGQPPQELMIAVLQHTSGPVCNEARKRLCDWADGRLEQNDRQILSFHLEHCSDCCALASSLIELKQILPEMATLEPDVGFTARVMQATPGRPSRARAVWNSICMYGQWKHLVQRPRIAWEAAYVGALLILLLAGNIRLPSSYLREADLMQNTIRQRGSRFLDSAAEVISERQQAALQTLKGFHMQSRSVLEDAADLQARTRRAIREKASSFIADLESEFRSAESPDIR